MKAIRNFASSSGGSLVIVVVDIALSLVGDESESTLRNLEMQKYNRK